MPVSHVNSGCCNKHCGPTTNILLPFAFETDQYWWFILHKVTRLSLVNWAARPACAHHCPTLLLFNICSVTSLWPTARANVSNTVISAGFSIVTEYPSQSSRGSDKDYLILLWPPVSKGWGRLPSCPLLWPKMETLLACVRCQMMHPESICFSYITH